MNKKNGSNYPDRQDKDILRKPTQEEMTQLIEACAKTHSSSLEDAEAALTSAYIAVWPNYISSCPGYTGKVFSVIYDGGPSFCDVYTEERDFSKTPPAKTGHLIREKRE